MTASQTEQCLKDKILAEIDVLVCELKILELEVHPSRLWMRQDVREPDFLSEKESGTAPAHPPWEAEAE